MHHPPQLMWIAFVLTVLIPALGAVSMCLMVWRLGRRFDRVYIAVLGLVIATVPMLSMANAHYVGGLPGEGSAGIDLSTILLPLLIWPILYFFLTVAGIISFPVVLFDRLRHPVGVEIKILVTALVLGLAVIQCGIDFELHVLRSS